MRIEIYVRNVYGRQVIYPANEAARDLVKLVNQVSLIPAQIALAKRLGLEIVQVPDPANAIAEL